jgi:Tat protein secretion system quality control protein TatD with DNase activity
VKYDIPVILHTRKAEKRVFDMLIEEGVKKADFHCFGGKVRVLFLELFVLSIIYMLWVLCVVHTS